MAHKSMVNGTSYGIVGGRSMVGGTMYDIKAGRTLVNGTRYNISFAQEDAYALRYSTTLRFQRGDEAPTGVTVSGTYSGFESKEYSNTNAPWFSYRTTINNVIFANRIYPISLAYWFNGFNKITEMDTSKLSLRYVKNMMQTFNNCVNLTGAPICGSNVTNFSACYYGCANLTGQPVSGDNVTNMYFTYYHCNNMTGSPVCGPNVTSLYRTYVNCKKLTGNPACGDKVTTMYGTYYGCSGLTGCAVCDNSVTNMVNAYYNCTNLGRNEYIGMDGCSVVGSSVKTMQWAFYNCGYLAGNVYIYSNNVTNAYNSFGLNVTPYSRSKMVNIFVPCGSNTLNNFIKNTAATSIIGKAIIFDGPYYTTNVGGDGYPCKYYNNTYNICIEAVNDVAAKRTSNGD